MPIAKLRLYLFLLGGFITCSTAAQQLDILEFPKEKRLLSIEARIGYYWDLGSLPDSIQSPVKEYYEKLIKGPRYDFSILYNWNDNMDVGLSYSFFNTSSQIDHISLVYINGNGIQKQLNGTLSGEIRQHYFSLRVDPSFKLGDYFYIKPGVNSGILSYRSITTIDSLRENISGAALTFELHLGLEYFVDNNWSLNLTGSYLLGILHEPSIENSLEEISSENLSGSLFKWHVGFGVRYNFTQKRAPVPRNKEVPKPVEKPSRFD